MAYPARVVIVLAAFACLAVAGEPEPVYFEWSELAGMTAELEAESLELRDELIASELAYLDALDKSLAEIATLPPEDPALPLAWARAEYLVETSFRLLAETGEYQAFLDATESLRPKPVLPLEPVTLAEGADVEVDENGGLAYETAEGRPLLPVATERGMGLIDIENSSPLTDYEGVTAVPVVPPDPDGHDYVALIKARAAWLRALTMERLGNIRAAAEEAAPLGLIRHWLVLGPLDSESDTYSYGNYPLEDILDGLDATLEYPGKNEPVVWRPHTSLDPLGRMYPGAMFRSPGPKSAFFLALVHSPENQAAVMRFGSDSHATVSVNHIQAGRTRLSGLPDPDQEAFNVWLRQGWNTILIRTSSPTGHGWGLAARLTTLDGQPFAGYVARPDTETVAEILHQARLAAARSALERLYDPGIPPELGGVSVLLDWLDDNEADARANFYLASFLVAKRMMEGPDRFDRELIFRRATELSGGDPYFTLMAARSVDAGVDGPDREENLRLVLLKAVSDQGSAAALVDIGRLYLDVMRQPRRADEYAELALTVNPTSLRAGVLDYDVAMAMDWQPVAKTLLESLARRHPTAAMVRLRQGRAALAGGRFRQALGEFHAILTADSANAEALDGAVLALGMLGQTSAAVDLLVTHIERFPYDFRVRLKLAELYRTLGRTDAAGEVLSAALAMAPDDPEARDMLRDIRRESYAEGKSAGAGGGQPRQRQELDLTPPKAVPGIGWEYLYFQVEDRMEKSGTIDRTVSFALKIYTDRAARLLRHLGFWLDQDFESGTVTRLDLIGVDGRRESFTPPEAAGGGANALKFSLPPLQTGMAVEAEVVIRRDRIPFLGEYFGQIAPLAQQAPIRLSRYLFSAPSDMRIFFRPANGAPEPMVVSAADGEETTRIWEMSGLPAYRPEEFAPGQHETLPCVQISSFENWDEFARWYWRLIGVQYNTPPELRLLGRRLEAGETLPIAKLDNAAAWVSRNIAHREWEYGPYAFRPINARSILSRLSADGKDRTLLLCLLAREYGLEAWPVLARLRTRRFAPAGPENISLPLLDHFNHSLTLVETGPGGDVFLDASNPYRPPGVMPSQLFGSPGVAVTPHGARLVAIPDGGIAACDWEERAEMVVDEDGSVLWEQSVDGVGTAAEMLRLRFRGRDGEDEAWTAFLASLGGTPSAASDTFVETAGNPASAAFSGRARLRNWASVEDDRVILRVPALPGAMSQSGAFAYPLSLAEMADQGERFQELVLPHGFRIRRRLTIRHPESWRLANPCVSFARRYPFGSVTVTSEEETDGLTLDIVVEVPGHRVAAADFPAFRELSALAARWLRPYLVWEKP